MMNTLTLRNPSFFRPSSRPTSPAPTAPRPDTSAPLERAARPHHKLSLNTFRRASPAPSPAPSMTPVTLVQDGSYLESLSLKLSEAVSKALAAPTGPSTATDLVGGKRPVPAGRGRALGALIASELVATRDKGHVHRAMIRCLHRPLSVLLNNLSAHLLPIISAPAFLVPPAPTPQAPNPNPTQLHALALAGFAGELLETFDELSLGMDADPRGDGLKVVRDGLVSLIGRVVNPLVGAIKTELIPLIADLEKPTSVNGAVHKTTAGPKIVVIQHPSMVTLQAMMPIYAKALARYNISSTSQATLASLLISLLWRSLMALSHRPQQPASRPNTPGPHPNVTVPPKRRDTGPSSGHTTPPAGRFSIKLPPSRPPSPPSVPVASSTAADARTLHDLLSLFPRPIASNKLACEAVDEAFDGLKALAALLEHTQSNVCMKIAPSVDDQQAELEVLTADLPTLIALPVLLRAHVTPFQPVSTILGLSEEEYRKGCLPGFSRAEDCAAVVGQRVLDALASQTPSSDAQIVIKWLESEIAAADD
ncbi:hypothetical protein HWV62_40639 [Athelia sp. TMB]|nr:hypothetical protein HWV62_40639 [Athelia sp. TMB]